MQHYERRSTEVDGIKLAYSQVGTGPSVVYIHGAMTTLEEGLIGLADTLSPSFEITAFDRPGHGESGRDAGTGSAWRQAALIQAACTELQLDRPVIIGHSFGCAVAMAMALANPESVSGVVLVAPIAFPELRLEIMMFGARAVPISGDWASLMFGPSDAVMMPALRHGMFLPQMMTPAFRDSFPFDLASGREKFQADGQDALAMIRSLTRSASKYASCQVPVHIVQGDQDLVVNQMLHARPLAAILPRGRFTNMPGLGHMAHHFAPWVVAEAVGTLHRQT
ncbi:MAG: alpha/beta fold hydrolase, partial [Brevundimonas sp.]